MSKEILKSLKKLELRPLGNLINKNNFFLSQLPSDYIEFMSRYDGGVGFVGDENNYIDLLTYFDCFHLK